LALTPTETPPPGRRTATLIAGGSALGALLALAVYLGLPKPPKQPPTTTSALPLTITGVQVSAVPSGTGFVAEATVSVANSGTTSQSTTLAGTIDYGGGEVATFPSTPVTVAASSSTTVTLESTLIPSTYAGQTLSAALALSNGATFTTSFTLPALATATGQATIEISSVQVSQPVIAGNPVTVTVTLINTGTATGTVTVSGDIELGGTVVATLD
jgi:hypothetical protein